ncbi:MAG: DUF2318 domain-containing protein [Acidobacteria bacterium]|nr:DUF2318 domain-containing protein [Acidobacteriota bacterium]
MKRWTPKGGILFVLAFLALFLAIDFVVEAGYGRSRFERVRPDADGVVRLDLHDLEPLEVRFYRFLNGANQEVEFLVGRDESGVVQVGFNANNSHYKARRGFSAQNGWIIDNKCETASRLSTINRGGGGCRPLPLAHRMEGDVLVLRESDILEGWRFFH